MREREEHGEEGEEEREREKSELIESLCRELPKLGNSSLPYKLVVGPSQVQPKGPTLGMHTIL